MAHVVRRTAGSSSTIKIFAFAGTITILRTGRMRALKVCLCLPTIGCAQTDARLTVSSDGSQIARHEVVGRPRTADYELAILKLLGGSTYPVLVFRNRLVIDQVGNVDEHAVRVQLLVGG